MERWGIFGFGHYLSDIADIIHARQDRICAIINNINPTEKQWEDLKRRIALFGYDVPVIEISDFKPRPDEKYFYGFFDGRDQVLADFKRNYGIMFSPLVHPAAYLGSNVRYGEGALISPHAVIGPNSRIGNFTRVNRASTIGHDTEIGDFSDVAPGAAIAGRVWIGNRTMIGIGSTVIDGIHIGSNSVVGAGSVVVKDVPDNVVVVGVPAKILRKNE
ncbi:MAG TPA: DapH/DapD/GlmU-related protein [Methanocella sp.]|uniref:DapH/DapD/GlmU-related protein n=1 Tax=Methanocella sp. TaxID=2052833 RepID=UPI002C1D55AC|nr:DapH/DapD/GlmU-related protein [Methanocella sp.]HTY91164.1 DapH/DapD/GlmU-related protein [Methanocella sp.]